MNKYVCTICGYIYDEAAGDPENGVAPATRWEDVAEDWTCPLCGATKAEFDLQQHSKEPPKQDLLLDVDMNDEMRELTFGELSALCSNLSKGCEKQYRPEEADLFNQLSEYYKAKTQSEDESDLNQLLLLVQQDLNEGYLKANAISNQEKDRGALRALTWGEKVTKILNSLLLRYEKQNNTLLENTNVYVCEICGFIYIGEEAPDICPVCKVPKFKIMEIQRG